MSEMNMREVDLDIRRSAQFFKPAMTVLEGTGKVEVVVKARPAPTKAGALVLAYATRDGTGPEGSSATAGQDYVATRGLLRFEPNDAAASLEVELINDDTCEADENFEIAFSLKPVGADIFNAKDPQVRLQFLRL
jgi:hypothetical protein